MSIVQQSPKSYNIFAWNFHQFLNRLWQYSDISNHYVDYLWRNQLFLLCTTFLVTLYIILNLFFITVKDQSLFILNFWIYQILNYRIIKQHNVLQYYWSLLCFRRGNNTAVLITKGIWILTKAKWSTNRKRQATSKDKSQFYWLEADWLQLACMLCRYSVKKPLGRIEVTVITTIVLHELVTSKQSLSMTLLDIFPVIHRVI